MALTEASCNFVLSSPQFYLSVEVQHAADRTKTTHPDEFKTIQMLTEKSCSFEDRIINFPSATTFYTRNKNRYPDILPKESSRVKLQLHTEQEGSDYINANYIFDKEYISTQAPMPSTIPDFWRMIWEQEVPVIVMLTKLFERGQIRAHAYWPDKVGETMNYGDISVQFDFETGVGPIDIKFFILSRMNETRKVAHLHYASWPDFGVPSSTREILNLVRLTEILRPETIPTAPIVVHCSAGIGRSGTFIGIHQAIRMIKSGKEPNICDLVLSMRNCRCGMVQTQEQYSFIHKTIHDYEAHRSHGCNTVTNESVKADRSKKLSRCSLDGFEVLELRMKDYLYTYTTYTNTKNVIKT